MILRYINNGTSCLSLFCCSETRNEMSLLEQFVALTLGFCVFHTSSAPVPGEKQMGIPDSASAEDDPPYPYVFGYQSEDGLGNSQHRHEESDGTGIIKGSYGYKDMEGIYRTVNYTADINGYRVVIQSNEPGVEALNNGDAVIVVSSDPNVSPNAVTSNRPGK
ncbi:cuticle protein 10.9-like [Parasteatoda tepidariorum]|uniref:cuticle protein 10.9-like n=1 Tax=Parasteatoda tepidariorum TaxID=114398 RepID=UPI00077FE382|nr:cuticle protein 10.9-like [Parasteatoda tepidariorum]